MLDVCLVFFFKHKTADEMRISDWSADVCSSDLFGGGDQAALRMVPADQGLVTGNGPGLQRTLRLVQQPQFAVGHGMGQVVGQLAAGPGAFVHVGFEEANGVADGRLRPVQGKVRVVEQGFPVRAVPGIDRSEEHTSELQSLMRISYAVFCMKKKKQTT